MDPDRVDRGIPADFAVSAVSTIPAGREAPRATPTRRRLGATAVRHGHRPEPVAAMTVRPRGPRMAGPDGRVALVTGASGGADAGVARRLADGRSRGRSGRCAHPKRSSSPARSLAMGPRRPTDPRVVSGWGRGLPSPTRGPSRGGPCDKSGIGSASPRRFAFGVVGPDRIDVGRTMCRQSGGVQDVLERRPDLDLRRPLLGLVEVDVPNDLVARAPGAARPWAEVWRHPEPRSLEVGPARFAADRAVVRGSGAGRTSASIWDGICANPQKSVELEPGTRSTTSTSRARA